MKKEVKEKKEISKEELDRKWQEYQDINKSLRVAESKWQKEASKSTEYLALKARVLLLQTHLRYTRHIIRKIRKDTAPQELKELREKKHQTYEEYRKLADKSWEEMQGIKQTEGKENEVKK